MNLLKKAQSYIEYKVLTKNHDESVLQESAKWAQSITWGLIATTGLSLAWLSLAKTEEIIVAPGTLVPVGSVQEIQMPIGGVIDEILVEDGDKVTSNQVLMRLDTEASKQRQKSILKNLEFKQKQLELKEQSSMNTLSNEDSINTLSQRILYEKEILERLKKLAAVGASAELQFLQQRNTVQEVEGRLREAKLDGLRQRAILGQDTQILKTEISNLLAEKADINVTLRYQVLRSPIDGIVFDLQPKGRGYSGKSSEMLMKIVPINTLEASVEIPSSDIGFVRTGMMTDLSIDSFPATDFGVLNGKIKKISSDALEPDPAKQKTEYRYPAIVELEEQSLSLSNGKSLSLQPGRPHR